MSCEKECQNDPKVDSGEVFLGEDQGWRQEAQSVINDINGFVHHISISEKLGSSRSHIYLNLTTIEENRYTIELTAQGFRVVGSCYDSVADPNADENLASFFETPYSLLESISPAYTGAFGEALAKKLSELQQQ